MARPGAVWLVALPLAAAGWLAAHCVAYLLVAPAGRHERVHGYLVATPLLLACGITLLAAGLALAVHHGLRGHGRPRVPVVPVALVPPLGFAAQEHVERLIEFGAFPLAAVLEPTFLVGMALQVPVALAAVALARVVSAFGYALGRELAVIPRARPPIALPGFRAWPEPEVARPPVLATGHGERAPPAAA